jgi:hypothetical protein
MTLVGFLQFFCDLASVAPGFHPGRDSELKTPAEEGERYSE